DVVPAPEAGRRDRREPVDELYTRGTGATRVDQEVARVGARGGRLDPQPQAHGLALGYRVVHGNADPRADRAAARCPGELLSVEGRESRRLALAGCHGIDAALVAMACDVAREHQGPDHHGGDPEADACKHGYTLGERRTPLRPEERSSRVEYKARAKTARGL